MGEPQYVVDVRPETATVVIGPKQALEITGAEVTRQTSVSGSPVQGRVLAQYRAHGEAVPVEVDGADVRFESPQCAVAPGQTIAFYRDDEVLGSAIISTVR